MDRALADAVAAHKAIFFRERDASGNWVDYEAAVSGGLRLVPTGASRDALADGYTHMNEDGLLPDDSETFDALMTSCEVIQDRANQKR